MEAPVVKNGRSVVKNGRSVVKNGKSAVENGRSVVDPGTVEVVTGRRRVGKTVAYSTFGSPAVFLHLTSSALHRSARSPVGSSLPFGIRYSSSAGS
jgi:hypothetical protein